MNFEEILDHAIAMLQRRGRVTYRTLKRQFQLDDDALEDLKEELIYGQRLAADEDGRVLVWMGGASTSPALNPSPPPHEEESPAAPHTRWPPYQLNRALPRQNAASSPCCFVTWSARLRSRRSLTPKSSARSCAPIKTPAPK